MYKFILIVLLVSHFQIAQACDCDSIIGKKEAKSIFKGIVLSITRIDSDFVRYEVVFRIKQKLKGKIKGKKITVNVPCLMDLCCGIPFKKSDEYIIFTFMRNGMLYTNACTQSKKLKDGHVRSYKLRTTGEQESVNDKLRSNDR